MRLFSVCTVSILTLGITATCAAQESESAAATVADPSVVVATESPATDEKTRSPVVSAMKGGHHCRMHSQGKGGMKRGHHGGGRKAGNKGEPGHQQGKHQGMMREKMMRHHREMEARLRSMEEQLLILHTKVDQLLRRP